MYNPHNEYENSQSNKVPCGVQIETDLGHMRTVPCMYKGERSESGETFTVYVDELLCDLHKIDSQLSVHKEDLRESGLMD